MENIGLMVANIAILLIRVMQFLMLARALLSWIPVPPALSGIYRALYTLTEPVVAPFRKLLFHFPMFRNLPLDFSFLLAYLALGIISRLFWFLLF